MRQFPIKDESIIAKSIDTVPKDSLPIVEMFYGIEGEGCAVGDLRILLRVGGCRVKCHGCDSPHTWNANNSTLKTLEQVKQELGALIAETKVKTVAITGGEPMHYPEQMRELAVFLREQGVRSWLETSGWIINREVFDEFDFLSFDVKTPSSKEACMTKDQVSAVFAEVDHHLNSNRTGSLYLSDAQIKAIVTNEADIDYIMNDVCLHAHEQVIVTRDLCGDKTVKYNDYSWLVNDESYLRQRLIITPACGKHSTPADIRARMELCMERFKGLPYRIIAQQHPLLNMP